MGQPQHEPSMEDILASIKRIIAEDGEAVTQRVVQKPPRKGPQAVPAPEPIAEPVAVEESVAKAPAPEPPAPPPIAAIPESEPEPEPESADVLELTSPLVDPPFETETAMNRPANILSPTAETASRSAFAALSQLQVRAEEGRENTLEGLVADLLRPMLRDYLDRELPAIVERLVADEVARVSGRG